MTSVFTKSLQLTCFDSILILLKSLQFFLIHCIWMLVEDKVRAEVISTSWLCNRLSLWRSLICQQLEPSRSRWPAWSSDVLGISRYIDFIGCNSAWADRTCGFTKAAEALYEQLHLFTFMKRWCGVKQGLELLVSPAKRDQNEMGGLQKRDSFGCTSCLWTCCCSLSRFKIRQLVLEWSKEV